LPHAQRKTAKAFFAGELLNQFSTTTKPQCFFFWLGLPTICLPAANLQHEEVDQILMF
jgi:hypothetical protein